MRCAGTHIGRVLPRAGEAGATDEPISTIEKHHVEALLRHERRHDAVQKKIDGSLVLSPAAQRSQPRLSAETAAIARPEMPGLAMQRQRRRGEYPGRMRSEGLVLRLTNQFQNGARQRGSRGPILGIICTQYVSDWSGACVGELLLSRKKSLGTCVRTRIAYIFYTLRMCAYPSHPS